MKYAITAMGRSGTKSISEYLGCCHELVNSIEIELLPTLKRFTEAPDGYGECSSYLRIMAPYLIGIKRAYIVRHPHNIAISAKALGHSVALTADGLACLYASISIDTHSPVFFFEYLIHDAELLAQYVGSQATGPLPHCNESVEGTKERVTLACSEKIMLSPFLRVRGHEYEA